MSNNQRGACLHPTTSRRPLPFTPPFGKLDDHYPTIVEDYGEQTIECAERSCLATIYDWWEVHRALITAALSPVENDEPDFGRCCGNYLDTGECCAAVHGTANLR